MKKYVVGFLFSEDKSKVALIRKKRPNWQKGRLNGVGGKIEEGESPTDAMIREFKEEAGIDIAKWREIGMVVGHDDRDEFKLYVFTAFGPLDGLRSVTDEEIEIISVHSVWFRRVIPNLRWLIPMARLNNTYSTVRELAWCPGE